MSFLTTNPSPFLLNLPAIQNVATSATGKSVVPTLLNTTTNTLQINTITTVNNASYLTIQQNTNFSNATISMNGTQILTSNSLNGVNSIAFQINGQEIGRINGTGFGMFTTTPTAPLHVVGDALITGNLYVRGTVNPSDPKLKENIQPYTVGTLPDPVSFTWKSTGQRDIGVLATDVLGIEPACVETGNGSMGVNYAKLVVLCLAELKSLRTQLQAMESTMREWQATHSVSHE
jgi:hypothetical protein